LRDWLESRNFIQIIYKFYRNGSILQKKRFQRKSGVPNRKKAFLQEWFNFIGKKDFKENPVLQTEKKARVSMRGLMFHCN
jgi:hypothetical protein